MEMFESANILIVLQNGVVCKIKRMYLFGRKEKNIDEW
jgi:hypothetical protein